MPTPSFWSNPTGPETCAKPFLLRCPHCGQAAFPERHSAQGFCGLCSKPVRNPWILLQPGPALAPAPNRLESADPGIERALTVLRQLTHERPARLNHALEVHHFARALRNEMGGDLRLVEWAALFGAACQDEQGYLHVIPTDAESIYFGFPSLEDVLEAAGAERGQAERIACLIEALALDAPQTSTESIVLHDAFVLAGIVSDQQAGLHPEKRLPELQSHWGRFLAEEITDNNIEAG